MWIIIATIIIFIIFADSDTKPSANKKGNTNTDSRLHCTVNRTGSYSSILNQMEQIVFLIAKRCPWMKLQSESVWKKYLQLKELRQMFQKNWEIKSEAIS